jgi:hypothetical protein
MRTREGKMEIPAFCLQQELNMEELVPFILGVLLGALFTVRTAGRTRSAAYAAAVALSGVVATAVSGEYQTSWVYLLLDCAEAALGLVAGLAIVARLPAWRNPMLMAGRSRDTP